MQIKKTVEHSATTPINMMVFMGNAMGMLPP